MMGIHLIILMNANSDSNLSFVNTTSTNGFIMSQNNLSLTHPVPGLSIPKLPTEAEPLITAEALRFIVQLVRQFRPSLQHLLDARKERQRLIDAEIGRASCRERG